MTLHAVYRARSFIVVALVASVLWGLVEALAQVPESRVASIEIRGVKRIEVPAIAGRLTLKSGDPYTAETVRGQVKILYDTGFFEDVQVETDSVAEGMAVTFVVQEKPFITEIVFDGNDQLSDDKLKEKTTIKSQTFLDQQLVKESAENMRQLYQHDGYYSAQVIPVIQTLDEERKRLMFHIREGEKAKIKEVIFEGLRAATKAEMFKAMSTREWIPWYGFFTKLKLPSMVSDAGVLKRDELANDVERIREVLLNKGYFNVRVGQPSVELSEDKKWFIVNYPIAEGEPFTIGEIGFRGHTVFEEPELREGLKIKEGEIFQRAKIRDEITRLTDLYGSKGYSFAEVVPSVNPNNEERTVSIILSLKEGEMMRIRQINVYGNDKTRDNVIRREIRVDEQDVIDTASLKRSFQRLNNLNFFETVEILPAQVAPDKVDLNVRVKEKPTGMFSVGGGFSTLDRLVAIADITQGNLGGYGWLGRIRGQLGQRRTLGHITFRNPYLNDSLTSLQVDGYRSLTNYLSYREERTGGSVTLGRWLSEYVTGSVGIFAEQITFRDPQPGICPDLVPIVCLQLGTQSSTGFRTTLFRDTRDYYIDPRTGWRFGGGLDVGTPYMGGTNNFIKYYVDVIKVTPLPLDLRISLRARYGEVQALGGTQVPLNERFFVGGINTMRGFAFGRAGPVVPTTRAPFGAAKQLIFNTELIFTISAEAKLNGVLFFDYGKGFDDGEPLSIDLRPAAGLEGRWISPFGPLRVAYGINLDARTGERQGVFEFTIGTLF
ncbi:MAG: outer membrane protein assembly factor BamA [Nitrospira sp.]|nr:outer membrane protein assembly factor BamA [Nitrospira sp.]MDH4357902.1 outer membrane protein assembly factor BamA [Nitrospira sp.]MDH5317568.1 outer membrane protein assembly factor BamA [Nitrospira sp.]